jgi:hypothetical protein
VLQRRSIDGVRVIPTLQQVAAALAHWHERHPLSV